MLPNLGVVLACAPHANCCTSTWCQMNASTSSTQTFGQWRLADLEMFQRAPGPFAQTKPSANTLESCGADAKLCGCFSQLQVIEWPQIRDPAQQTALTKTPHAAGTYTARAAHSFYLKVREDSLDLE